MHFVSRYPSYIRAIAIAIGSRTVTFPTWFMWLFQQPVLRCIDMTSSTNKSHIFQPFEVLQALSDKADDMTINIEIRAHTKQEFDPSWIRNAIEEPLDEMNIKASTWLE